MCDPVSIGVGFAVVGATVGAVSALRQGSAAKGAAQANANLIDMQARQREHKAQYDEAQKRNAFLRVRGRQQAIAGKSGLSMLSFSDVFEDSALESALEIKAIRYSAAADVYQLKYQRNVEVWKGNEAKKAGQLAAVGAIAKGGAQAFGAMPESVSLSSPWETTTTYGAG
jgi:hypothetical protein